MGCGRAEHSNPDRPRPAQQHDLLAPVELVGFAPPRAVWLSNSKTTASARAALSQRGLFVCAAAAAQLQELGTCSSVQNAAQYEKRRRFRDAASGDECRSSRRKAQVCHQIIRADGHSSASPTTLQNWPLSDALEAPPPGSPTPRRSSAHRYSDRLLGIVCGSKT
jgi:hypothetical protein